MNSSPNPESNQPTEAERLLFLLSRQFDGDLTLEESTAITEWKQADSQADYLAAMSELRSRMKALPIQRVPESFLTSVQATILQQSNTTTQGWTPEFRHGWIRRGVVAVSVTTTVVALVLLMQSAPVRNSQDVANTSISEASQMMATPATAGAANEIRDAESMPLNFPAMGGASGDMGGASAEENVVAQQEELQPFLENDDWRIVIVKVDSKDRDEVMRDIEAVVKKNGMDIRPLAGHDADDARFGVLLSSISVNDNAFIESFMSESEADTAEWNAESIADSTRQNLISRLQESMKTPTHSELHFGQVYVALPKFAVLPVIADRPLPAQNAAAADRSIPSPPAAKFHAGSSNRTSPVLVVFEFAKTPF